MVSTNPIPLHPPGSEPLTDAGFAHRLATVRRPQGLTQQGLTQQVVSDRAGVHVTNIRRYEASKAASTVHILRYLAVALHVSAVALLFDPGERGPRDDLALCLEAVSRLDSDEKTAVLALIEFMLLRHEARRLTAPRTAAQEPAQTPARTTLIILMHRHAKRRHAGNARSTPLKPGGNSQGRQTVAA
jgi:transcriptional regulator with XRE-family HTH domain